ncbi:ankyrin repeat domain-containing protein [Sulfuricystis multivorans]|uniref:ankyrin repeat domain-containing protein n=1 Tax=Sulfuricystis multivorans TaxID=2211108 RepID=UPI001559A3D2|nr:ankyrin repeat domain-containing protein [Sulfuricystis multivorans]
MKRWLPPLFALLLPLSTAFAELPDPARFSAALELGDIQQAAAWLDEGLDPNFEGQLIGTGLMIGAWEGNIPLMELFLARGADIDRANRFGETALMLAAWKNRQEAVRWLLAHGARPNPGKERVWTALHYAAFAGHARVVEDLLAAGAEVNARSTNGSTVVMMAAREGHASIAQRLIDAGANPALKNDYGDDAVAWAMRQGNYDIAKLFTSTENFAALARQAAENPPAPPVRSLQAPDRVDELLRKARLAEMAGKRDEALLIYRQAWEELKALQAPRKVGADKTPPAGKTDAGAKTPKALVIRAKRNAPEKQSLTIRYAESEDASADQWLERARAAEAAGERHQALEFYRRAAAAIRASAAQ